MHCVDAAPWVGRSGSLIIVPQWSSAYVITKWTGQTLFSLCGWSQPLTISNRCDHARTLWRTKFFKPWGCSLTCLTKKQLHWASTCDTFVGLYLNPNFTPSIQTRPSLSVLHLSLLNQLCGGSFLKYSCEDLSLWFLDTSLLNFQSFKSPFESPNTCDVHDQDQTTPKAQPEPTGWLQMIDNWLDRWGGAESQPPVMQDAKVQYHQGFL